MIYYYSLTYRTLLHISITHQLISLTYRVDPTAFFSEHNKGYLSKRYI